MHYVTTCHLEGFTLYGQRLLDGWKHLPKSDRLTWYTEGYEIPEVAGVEQIDNGGLDRLQAFKQKYGGYRSPYYLWDVVRFSHKIFSCYHAMRDGSGLMAWLDADIVPISDVPEGWAESLLEKGDYIAMFRRKSMYSECGFWIVDCDHPAHQRFFDTLIDLYESDVFKKLREWHDSYLMDVVVRQFEADGLISVTNLTTADVDHPMAIHPVFSRYFDHLKGPERKKLGYSPEHALRQAA